MRPRDEFPLTVRQAVGRNVRRVRHEHGITADDLAGALRYQGLKWNENRVAELERGEKAVGVEEVLLLSRLLTELAETPVTIPALFSEVDAVRLTPVATMTGEQIQHAFSGQTFEVDRPSTQEEVEAYRSGLKNPGGIPPEIWERYAPEATIWNRRKVAHGAGSVERKAAHGLGVPVDIVVAASAGLWGESMTTRRNTEAGSDATPQKRGHVTRQMLAELDAYIRIRRGND